MAEPSLHPDAAAWAVLWEAYLAALEKATADISTGEDLSWTASGGQDRAAQSGTKFVSEIAQNEAFAKVEIDPYKALADEGIDGFPKSKKLTDDYLTLLKTRPLTELIPLQRQLDFLEAFRKAYLSKRQRKAHMLQHLQVMRNQGDLLRASIRRSMLNAKYASDVERTV